MTDEGQPSCDLLEVQFLVRLGRFGLSAEVARTMSRDDLDRALLHRCFESLSPADFHKTMPSERDRRTMLDVYRPALGQQRLYLKFKIQPDGDGVFILSFKKDTSR
jgi:hypothetical protein